MDDFPLSLRDALGDTDDADLILAARYIKCLKAIRSGQRKDAAELNGGLLQGLHDGELSREEIITFLLTIEQAIAADRKENSK